MSPFYSCMLGGVSFVSNPKLSASAIKKRAKVRAANSLPGSSHVPYMSFFLFWELLSCITDGEQGPGIVVPPADGF